MVTTFIIIFLVLACAVAGAVAFTAGRQHGFEECFRQVENGDIRVKKHKLHKRHLTGYVECMRPKRKK